MQTALGCTPARGLDDARAVALSPDGKSLYVASATPASVTSFGVAPGNGLLAQLNLGAGCLASIAQDGCGGARSLEGASAIVVSPDSLHVYVASATAGSVTSFVRQPNGSLAQLAGLAGCITALAVPGCGTGPPLAGAGGIAISPDGRFVYVAAGTADAIIAFSRDAASGRLTPLPGIAGCLRANRPNCTPVSGIDGPSSIAISPDGTSLYVTSATAGTLTSFQRDVNTGVLTQLPAGVGCLSDAAVGDCTPIGGLARASSVVVTPDGLTVVAVGTDDDAVLSFRRDAATSALTRVSCVAASAATAGCTVLPLIQGPRAVTIRPGGFVAWVAASRGDSIVSLQLDIATGALTPTPTTAGCLRRIASQECRATRALDDPRGLATSPDGSRLYVASALSDGIAVLGPQLAPNCLPVRAGMVANKSRSVVLACSDPNGDPVTLTIRRQPKHGQVRGLVKATHAITYTPAIGYAGSDSFTYTATDGLDTSVIATAVISVTLPPKAPLVRIRTGRTPLLRGGRIHVLVECPPTAIGPCKVAVHVLIKGRSAGYGFAKLRPRSTGRVVTRATGIKGRTQAQVVVTVRDRSRRATIARKNILIVP